MNNKQTKGRPAEVIRRQPNSELLAEWMDMGGCEATDGCWVEPDGKCEHGCLSWLIVMGMI
jgi:hypothetical protein